MRESDYIRASNLVRANAALDLLKAMTPPLHAEDCWRNTICGLHGVIEEIQKPNRLKRRKGLRKIRRA